MSLRGQSRYKARRSGFTLAELVVSAGILALMFALAGQVFSVTLQSTSKASALTSVNQALRHFEQTLRKDLKHVQPGSSIMVIQGNPVNAYWTQAGKDAAPAASNGDPSDPNRYHTPDPEREDENGNLISPRADILMFFTARRARSYVSPGVTSELQQVVYGHAELGEYVPSTLPNEDYVFASGPDAFPVDVASNYPDPDAISLMPAESWHLARRSVLLMPNVLAEWADSLTASATFDDIRLGAVDIVGGFNYEQQVLEPEAAQGYPLYLPAVVVDWTDNVGIYARTYARSRLDQTPPPLLAERLGHYFLPRCASFKVEWSLDGRSELVAGSLDGESEVLWIDPAGVNRGNGAPNPFFSLDEDRSQGDPVHDLVNVATAHSDGSTYSLAERYRDDPDNWSPADDSSRINLMYFGATRRRGGSTGELVAEDVFPKALRITVDVFDANRRLERPMRHVIIVPVG